MILVDAADRVLLWRSLWDRDRPELGFAWFTPGGGVGDGEPLAVAAARELAEETGLAVSPEELGEPVAYASGMASLGYVDGLLRDDFYVLRVDAHEVDTAGHDDFERDHIVEHRWWTRDELASATDMVIPYGLAALLTDLLDGRRPAEPVRLPWHHEER